MMQVCEMKYVLSNVYLASIIFPIQLSDLVYGTIHLRSFADVTCCRKNILHCQNLLVTTSMVICEIVIGKIQASISIRSYCNQCLLVKHFTSQCRVCFRAISSRSVDNCTVESG